jgi:hypothetical protein
MFVSFCFFHPLVRPSRPALPMILVTPSQQRKRRILSCPRKYKFASRTLHMPNIIILSMIRGWGLPGWTESGQKAHLLIARGIGAPILAPVIMASGTKLKALK